MIYLDNAATSFPKPQGVSRRMKEYLDLIGAPVNRSVYGAAQEVDSSRYRLRQRLADCCGFPSLPAGAADGRHHHGPEPAIARYVRPGDHCLVKHHGA